MKSIKTKELFLNIATSGKTFEDVEMEVPPSGGSAGDPPDDPLWAKLSAIPGLNTEYGVSHTGGSREGYYLILHEFCSGFDEGMNCIARDVENENWKDYFIRFHSYKGMLAMIGHKALSEWAEGLEVAGKAASAAGAAPAAGAADASEAAAAVALCKGITPSVCEAMRAFRDDLLGTSNGELLL
jgi:HPt (histidine-containing phosphotransfer) domain-containing protein